MIKKVQSYLNIVLVLFLAFGIVYFLVNLIIDAFKTETIISSETIVEYKKEDKVVTSYSLFNVIEECISNLYESLMNEKYTEIYEIVGKNTKKQYSKEEILSTLKDYSKNTFGIEDIMSGHTIKLNKAYEISSGKYIAEIKSTYTEKPLDIIFNVDLYESTYTIDLIM